MPWSQTPQGSATLRLRSIPLRAPATLRHELVELHLVLGVPQPVEEFHELALLFFEPAYCFGPVLVKGAVAARATVAPAAAPSLGCRLHPLHALLHSFHAT